MFQLLLPIIGAALSAIKGKKTQQNTQMDPRQNYAYGELLKLLLKKNQQGSDPMNQVRNMFYGQQQPQQPFVGGDATSPYAIRNRQGNPGA